jgi:hypothetical protein
MGVWIDILQLGAAGKSAEARAKLSLDLPAALRDVNVFMAGPQSYQGPLPKAVRHFAASLPPSERSLLQTYECDLVDHILDDVMAEAERTLFLVELCRTQPEITLMDLVALFPWAAGLNRNEQWKQQRMARYLKSLTAIGIALPAQLVANVAVENSLFEFHEIKFAVAQKRLEYSWKDFKEDHEQGSAFLCIDDSEESTDSYAESSDYGSIRMAEVVLKMARPENDFDLQMDLRLAGEALGPELTTLMEQLHSAKPTDGYRPIAWHNVFWRVTEKYDWLALLLVVKEPQQETDQALAEHLAASYPDVVGVSRPTILRRRTRLDEACEEKIVTLLRERFVTELAMHA